MSDTFISFVVVIVGHPVAEDGMAVVESTPYWEFPAGERDEAIAHCVVAWCNKHGTAPESVIVRAITP